MYLESNSVGAEGCKHLVSAEWEKLTRLVLGMQDSMLDTNKIGSDGCKHLATAKWDHLF